MLESFASEHCNLLRIVLVAMQYKSLIVSGKLWTINESLHQCADSGSHIEFVVSYILRELKTMKSRWGLAWTDECSVLLLRKWIYCLVWSRSHHISPKWYIGVANKPSLSTIFHWYLCMLQCHIKWICANSSCKRWCLVDCGLEMISSTEEWVCFGHLEKK